MPIQPRACVDSADEVRRLAAETVKGTALALESVDNIEGGDGLALGVLSVGYGVTDDGLEEGLEDTAGLFVDHWDDVRKVMVWEVMR
jgi:hypothetical protein